MTRRDLLRSALSLAAAPLVALVPSVAIKEVPLGPPYPHWHNYTGRYSRIDKSELIRRMREIHRTCKFKPPLEPTNA